MGFVDSFSIFSFRFVCLFRSFVYSFCKVQTIIMMRMRDPTELNGGVVILLWLAGVDFLKKFIETGFFFGMFFKAL